MKILFMGTPEIAASCLTALSKAGHRVCGAVCQPDKPVGRRYVLTPPPVKVAAAALGIPVFQPETLRDGALLPVLRTSAPELIAVVAYGKLLPPYVLEFPRYGCINLHVSLLPKYRGAAPMQRAVMAGERQTGVTVMYMAQGMDTGDILSQVAFPIAPEDDFGAVCARSAELGGPMLAAAADALAAGTAGRVPQCEAEATFAPKITKEDCTVDFSESAEGVLCRIRGLSPAPLAFTWQEGRMLKLLRAMPGEGEDAYGRLLAPAAPVGLPGEVLSLSVSGEGGITVACGAGVAVLTRLLPEGKGAMSAADYIRGRKIRVGEILGAQTGR